MKKLHIFILKNYLGPFVMTFFICLFILLMQFLWKYIDDLVGKGLEWYIIAQLLFYASSTFVPLALPLAILLSSLMSFGNMGEHYELVALKASGISLQKIMKPLIILSIIISIAAFLFSNYILPIANLKMGSLLFDVREQKPALNIKEGIFYTGIDDYTIKVGKKDKDGKTIHNIIIYDLRGNNGSTNVTLAERGFMETTTDKRFLIFTLFNGCNYFEDLTDRETAQNRPLRRTLFKEQYKLFDLSAFKMSRTNEEFFKNHYQMLNLKQLNKTIDSLKIENNDINNDFRLNFFKFFYFFSTFDTLRNHADTIKTPIKSNFIENFDKQAQTRIFEHALNTARNNKDYLTFNKEDDQSRRKIIIKYDIEWHRKFTLSIACLLLFFIGAPMGAIIRKGGFGLPVVIAVLFFVVFHVISITSEKFVREGEMLTVAGMWLSVIVFMPLGIYLTSKATTDSSLFDAESYTHGFKKIINIFTKRKKNENSSNM